MLNIKNAPHANAARLFMEWTLSEEGQLVLSRQGYASVRQGVKSIEPEAEMSGVTFFPRDSTPEADQMLGTDKERTVRWDSLFFK
jgi:ABC-type Fe3+ transport system substrate-binding protein